VDDSAGGQLAAGVVGFTVHPARFRVEFSEFCMILKTDSLSLLVLLVYLNLVRIRVLQYLGAKEI
jgi:hypothetical protein